MAVARECLLHRGQHNIAPGFVPPLRVLVYVMRENIRSLALG